ncbi:MAG: trypsin-like serine protease, partial [Polyangiaceae bacterium]
APVTLGSLAAGDVGKTVKMAGFGITEDGGGIGVKRVGTGIIQSIDTETFRMTPSPSMTCDGDSGGPLFLSGAGGDELVGITSYGDPGCTMFAENARVDAFAAFIDGVIAGAPDGGADPDPADSPPANVCSGSCASATECGAGFDCPASADAPGKCTLNGLPAGDFGDKCTEDNDCPSAICARLGSSATSCRCLTACAISGPSFDGSVDAGSNPAPPDTSTGCACRFAGSRFAGNSAGFHDDLWIAIGGFFFAIKACRRRKIGA